MRQYLFFLIIIIHVFFYLGCSYTKTTEKLRLHPNEEKHNDSITLTKDEYQRLLDIFSERQEVNNSTDHDIVDAVQETDTDNEEIELNSNHDTNNTIPSESLISIPTSMNFSDDKIFCDNIEFEKPGWLQLVNYSKALCVSAPENESLRIDYSQNLISKSDFRYGDPTHQIYYSLSQLEVPAGGVSMVLGVCGGSGEELNEGDFVIPSFKPSNNTKIPSNVGFQIQLMSKRFNALRMFYNGLKHLNRSSEYVEYERQLEVYKIEEVKLQEIAAVIRAAVKGSINNLLKNATN